MQNRMWGGVDYRVYRLIVVAWMALIFMMSHQATLPVPGVFPGQDKFMHFWTYGVLGFLVARSLGVGREGLSPKHIVLVTVVGALYGVSDEFHQFFVVGRDSSYGDVLADTLGAFFSAFLLRKGGRLASFGVK